ncbi:hypothetical protein GCM10010259_52090 [Streptomyces daghestanicus]|uniref:Uncharacterized protein n=1 Tax=Streptomyces daghestanicus TaxID=66885 RepID=A0ABQ3Q4L0_9ACTN|nr:hypothetical protein GCM10010259_52090 [Streptomyces daghestanicus]GHI32225.1 hypothetical protein Sdagh_39550 [Streptomyces daghestanicus]
MRAPGEVLSPVGGSWMARVAWTRLLPAPLLLAMGCAAPFVPLALMVRWFRWIRGFRRTQWARGSGGPAGPVVPVVALSR